MSAGTIRILIALFLVAHGLMHYSLTTVPLPQPGGLHTPFWPAWWRPDTDPAWLASRLGLSPQVVRTAGWMLWVIALIGYTIAGLGILGLPGAHVIWAPSAIVASLASLALLVFYWHAWLVMGVALDVAILAGLYFRWPANLFPLS